MRKTLKNKPLTLAEKIIYGHLDDPSLAPVRDAARSASHADAFSIPSYFCALRHAAAARPSRLPPSRCAACRT